MTTSNFDDNILQNILSRLHLKHANQLKLVCSRWNNLISDHLFKKTQAVQSINNVLGIISITKSLTIYIPIERCTGNNQKLPDIPDPNKACIKAACNGLIFYEPTQSNMNAINSYLLRNMTTKSSTSIPKDHLLARNAKAIFGIAFHPLSQTSPIVVACIHAHKKIFFYKYSLSSREKEYNWRISKEPLNTELELFKTVSSVFVNGALHWLTKNGNKAVAFNVGNDIACTMELPVEYRIKAGYPDIWFGVANEKLCLVKINCEGIHIWEMIDYCSKGTTWVCRRQIKMPKGPNKCYSNNLPVLYDGKKVVIFTSTERNHGVAVYRIQEKRWDKIMGFRDSMNSGRHFFPYISHGYSLDRDFC